MKRARLFLGLKPLLLVVGLSAFGLGIYYHQVIHPKRWVGRLHQDGAELADEEWREAYHDAIRWGGDHDSFIGLMSVGDESSISHLIEALEDMPGPMGCTKDHCIDALRAITKEDFGGDAVAWKRWFKSHQRSR